VAHQVLEEIIIYLQLANLQDLDVGQELTQDRQAASVD
jgi:hypothetical protein